jgi:hypothetical protein
MMPERNDGFGAQFLNIFRALSFIETNNHTFIFDGIKTMISDDTDGDNMHYKDKLVNYMNISQFYLSSNDIKIDEIFILPEVITFYHLFVADFEKYHSSPSFIRYKKIFLHDKKNPYDTTYYNVALHVRKADRYYTADDQRIFDDTYYLNFCKKIRSEYRGEKPLRFHIYSNGVPEDFNYLKEDDVIFHLKEDLMLTHLGFIFADVLLTGYSCLSYTAAFFSNGTVYYKYWNHLHIGLKSWIQYE